jgi:hypothetical protein
MEIIRMNREVGELRGNVFQQSNALIFRPNRSHTLAALSQPEKNIEIRVIVVAKQAIFRTKKG